MVALRATGAGEAVGEDAALEIAAELTLDVTGNRVGIIGSPLRSASQVSN